MFKINLKLIIRNIWKYKGFSIINISGLSIGVFILGGAIALIVAFIPISLQTSKAAIINPADSLRYE